MRRVGLDAEDDERAGAGRFEAGDDGIAKSVSVGDDMIGGGEQDEAVRVALLREEGGDAGGWCGVPSSRLKNDTRGLRADLFELLGDQKTQAMIAEHREVGERFPGQAEAG